MNFKDRTSDERKDKTEQKSVFIFLIRVLTKVIIDPTSYNVLPVFELGSMSLQRRLRWCFRPFPRLLS